MSQNTMPVSLLGRSKIQVSRICLGTMTYGQQNSEPEAFEQMDYARQLGINFFDTAELYAIPPRPDTCGATEIIIGNWLKARSQRDQIVLATKITGRTENLSWIRNGSRHTKAQIDEAIEGSLKRLQTDYIDLYQLHWPDRRYAGFGFHTYQHYDDDYASFETILEALETHKKAGRIREIGLSNESPFGVMKFLGAGHPRVQSIQNAYNLVNRTFEYGLAEIALNEQVGLLAYSPLAQGYLTGKYRGGSEPKGARRTLFGRMGRYEGPGGLGMIDAYCDLAQSMGWDPADMALKFVDTRPFVTATIIGATTMDQLKSNCAAFNKLWTAEIEKAVNALHASHPNPCP
jgi:aryl-alcohol dehydrogenase-like predicted oxidoreductase